AALPTCRQRLGKHSRLRANGAPALDLGKRYGLFLDFISRFAGRGRLDKGMLQECHQKGYGAWRRRQTVDDVRGTPNVSIRGTCAVLQAEKSSSQPSEPGRTEKSQPIGILTRLPFLSLA